MFHAQQHKNLSIKLGDLNMLDRPTLSDALQSDVYVVFGASYIRDWLIDFLVNIITINIHMGLSPYYRGSSLWALYDNNAGYVGDNTPVGQGLDSGDMLFTACQISIIDGHLTSPCAQSW